ncbi:hypothetical protein M406DRAFT_106951 [Cryphonectria parasitica EP155]|uniref:Uncharacterized protein n=1 Tax=Cryphonectria parasitica (strain ATCC 38755 / EP155) TaxID=660469 RepID=A0A9P4Y1Z5_CRYP1|nr:uncharacterized protein M406DRAFT_106951 [Cryphonectria parasitica EP155]KAF3765151.1 hypothetical protein M406DRAFT_106951 [Cryphonectria parasitica EP155]
MPAPRAKRQFAGAASDPAQRQITSFFHATTTSSDVYEDGRPSRPVLPTDTQSNLLNVGMRIRKSVPEGYKTGGPYSALALFDDLDRRQPALTVVPTPIGTTHIPSSSSYTTAQRELLPFCGINKVGGLASQPSSSLSYHHSEAGPVSSHALHHHHDALPGLDDVPSLSSSQTSVASSTTSLAPNKKRVYDDGEESDTPSVSSCLQVPSGDWMDGQVSPRSLVPVGWDNTRVMAVPKKLRRSLRAGGVIIPAVTIAGVDDKALGQLGQENMMLDEDDFPDADFLDYRVLADDPMET